MSTDENISKIGQACILNSKAIEATNARITMLEDHIYNQKPIVKKSLWEKIFRKGEESAG